MAPTVHWMRDFVDTDDAMSETDLAVVAVGAELTDTQSLDETYIRTALDDRL